jgi:hypothetical protein
MTSQPVHGRAGAVGALKQGFEIEDSWQALGMQQLCSPSQHFSDANSQSKFTVR